MNPLTHSEAHERLADLSLEPAALRRLADDLAARAGPGESALQAHVRVCDACRAEIDTWSGVHETVTGALAGPESSVTLGELSASEPMRAPAALRSAVAQIAAQGKPGPAVIGLGKVALIGIESGAAGAAGIARSPGRAPVATFPNSVTVPPRRSVTDRWVRRLLPLVAVLAVLVVSGGLLLDQSHSLDQARSDAAALSGVTAALDRVMLDPGHRAVALTAADGSRGGSVAWSSHDLVVLTTSLAKPPSGAVYRCWIERDGRRSPIGRMYFADGTGYWTGSLDDWATTSFAAGSTFGISLEPATGPTGTPAVLVADLGA